MHGQLTNVIKAGVIAPMLILAPMWAQPALAAAPQGLFITQSWGASKHIAALTDEFDPGCVLSRDASVPPCLSEDVPLYRDMEFIETVGDPGDDEYLVQGITADAIDRVLAFFQQRAETLNWAKYPTLDAARAAIFDYIERFHNPRMRRRVAKQDQKFLDLFKPSVKTG